MAFEKIFQAVGSMKTSMVSLLCGCIVNIILDPMMIFGWGFPEMGIKGAALASGIGQSISLAIYIVVYFLRPISVKLSKQHLSPDGRMIGRLYSIGVPAALNLALPSILISALNAILAAFSEGVRPGSGNILQAANLPVSSHKRNNPGNAPAYRITTTAPRV